MATPAVAGAMALRAPVPDARAGIPPGHPIPANAFDPSAALLRAMAVNAGRNDITGFRVPDNTIGYGRLTIDDVPLLSGGLEPHAAGGHAGWSVGPAVRRVPGAGHGSHADRSRSRCAGRTLPATRHPRWQIVNDLDLIVTHDGSTYRGNYLLNYVSARRRNHGIR